MSDVLAPIDRGDPGMALKRVMHASVAKRFWRGTNQRTSPAESLARLRPLAGRMGITRLSNVTGLDRVGIPVAIAVRPDSRAGAVAQGSGIDLPRAMVSALMKAAEGFHAERIGDRIRLASWCQLAAERIAVAEPAALGAGRLDDAVEIAWIAGYDLLQDEKCWVPAELVHTDFRPSHQAGTGYFAASPSGFGSGNDIVEALNAALCELVERDAVAIWMALGLRARTRRHLDAASVQDAECRRLLALYAQADIAVRLWDVTSDIGIATFICDVSARSDGVPDRLRRFRGAGCHPDPAIALARALTEAARCRLGYVAGIRNDPLAAHAGSPDAEIEEALLDVLEQESEPLAFAAVPRFLSDDPGEDLRWLLRRLLAGGLSRVIAVDLTRPELGIPVVRVVVPGLEGTSAHPHHPAGSRARRMAQ